MFISVTVIILLTADQKNKSLVHFHKAQPEYNLIATTCRPTPNVLGTENRDNFHRLKMAIGGRRPGSGRKRGNSNVKTREIADRAIAEGITPLEVMLNTMRKFYDEGEFLQASTIAKDAAPYIHPRLQTIEHGGPDGGPIQVTVARFTPDAGET